MASDGAFDVFEEAKSFLLHTDVNGGTLYDHLSDVMLRILEQRPKDSLLHFENLSLETKKAKLINAPPVETPQKEPETIDDKLAILQTNLFKNFDVNSNGESQTLPNEGDLPDLIDEANFFEWGGVGLGKEEVFRISLSLKHLLETNPLQSVRFFGKIFGKHNDYLIAETEYKENARRDDGPQKDSETENEDRKEQEETEKSDEEGEKNASVPPKIPQVEPEENVGTNRFVYWVTSSPGEPWVKLPYVTPQQIVAARNIRKFLTGNLSAPVNSFPPFPGNEANYLRAQIARIAAATVISPKGAFTAEEDDSGEVPVVQHNQEFEGFDVSDLLQLNNWVHHTPHILKQGRCSFFNIKQETEEEEDEEKQPEIEEGPKALTEISEDKQLGKFDAWTVYSATSSSKYSHAIVRSNRWPGAYSFAKDDRFANIYIGFGHKYTGPTEPYSPPLPATPQKEAETPQESEDATVEQEEALEKSKKEDEIREETGEGSGGEEGSAAEETGEEPNESGEESSDAD